MSPPLKREKLLTLRRKEAPAADATPPAAGETEKAGPELFTFVANDGDFDHYDDRNTVEGWQLDLYNGNPLILWMHDDSAPNWLGLRPEKPILPIGKGRAYVEGNALMVDVEFDMGDAFAAEISRKVKGGFLSAVSVRYLLVEGKYRENERHGYDSDEQVLLEVSVVTIPGNPRALRQKGASTEEDPAVLAAAEQRAVEILSRLKGPGIWLTTKSTSDLAVALKGALAAPPPAPSPAPPSFTADDVPGLVKALFTDTPK